MLVFTLYQSRGKGIPESKAIIETPTGELIEVELIETRTGKARLGFTAPGHIKIHRKVVWDEIDAARAAEKANDAKAS